jgi:LacI family transcriptional regulator
MTEATGLHHARRFLSLPRDRQPTAFICSSIGQATGIKRACAALGLAIGKDVALIAHDDRIHDMGAENFDPPLTATQSSIGDAGRRIVELCTGMLRDPDAPLPSEVWAADLVVRGSTMPVR